jgi:TetR/AcrR family transcriptional regulator, transcriptional repressor for nem operon
MKNGFLNNIRLQISIRHPKQTRWKHPFPINLSCPKGIHRIPLRENMHLYLEQSFKNAYLCITMARSKEFDPEERLEKARDLFREKGYHATSMQDLVDTMKLNRGSIYDTYGDKHALFLQCLSKYADETMREYKSAAAGAKSPVQAITQIIHKAVEKSLAEGKSCMVVKTSFELEGTDKAAHDIIRHQGEALVSVFESLLKQAQETGEIRSGKDPNLIAIFIVSNFTGFWQLNISKGDPQLIHRLAEYLIQLIKM